MKVHCKEWTKNNIKKIISQIENSSKSYELKQPSDLHSGFVAQLMVEGGVRHLRHFHKSNQTRFRIKFYKQFFKQLPYANTLKFSCDFKVFCFFWPLSLFICWWPLLSTRLGLTWWGWLPLRMRVLGEKLHTGNKSNIEYTKVNSRIINMILETSSSIKYFKNFYKFILQVHVATPTPNVCTTIFCQITTS